MNTSLRKILAGTALTAAIALGTAGAASAEQVGPVSVSVPAGGRSCVTTSQPAYYKMRADGSAPAALSGQAQWTVHQSFDGANFQTLVSLSGNYFSAAYDRTVYSNYFPGYWRFCVRNTSTTTVLKATLTLKTDANA